MYLLRSQIMWVSWKIWFIHKVPVTEDPLKRNISLPWAFCVVESAREFSVMDQKVRFLSSSHLRRCLGRSIFIHKIASVLIDVY